MYLIGHQFLSQIAHQQKLKKRQADHLSNVKLCMLNEPQNRIAPNLIIGMNRLCRRPWLSSAEDIWTLRAYLSIWYFLSPEISIGNNQVSCMPFKMYL